MSKKTIITIIVALAVIAGAILLFRQAPAAGSIALYYGQECPHCAAVEDYIKANNIDAKVKIDRLEVFHNQDNADQMAKVAQKCGIQGTQLGVPLLYDGSKCYEGQDEVTNYLQQYLNK